MTIARHTVKEFGSEREKRDEKYVQNVMEVITYWRNPSETSEELVSLFSGSIANESLKEDLLMTKEKGKSGLVSFVEDRLTTNTIGFFDKLPRLNQEAHLVK